MTKQHRTPEIQDCLYCSLVKLNALKMTHLCAYAYFTQHSTGKNEQISITEINIQETYSESTYLKTKIWKNTNTQKEVSHIQDFPVLPRFHEDDS